MPRKKKAGDTAYNARRRFRRQAERYMKQAENAVGANKARFESLAADALEKAVALYENKSKVAKPIQTLADKLNIDIGTIGKTKNKLRGISQSYEALVNQPEGMGTISRRDREAQALLRRGNVKSRFYGGLIDIWEGLPPDERDTAILDYFGVESLMDVINELTDAGINIFEPQQFEGEMSGEVGVKVAAYVAQKA